MVTAAPFTFDAWLPEACYTHLPHHAHLHESGRCTFGLFLWDRLLAGYRRDPQSSSYGLDSPQRMGGSMQHPLCGRKPVTSKGHDEQTDPPPKKTHTILFFKQEECTLSSWKHGRGVGCLCVWGREGIPPNTHTHPQTCADRERR